MAVRLNAARTSGLAAPAILKSPLDDDDFKAQLVCLIPHLRAFARSIARGPEAEDIAQETMLRAWKARASFQAGTNLKGWVFTILRNESYSRGRRSWRTQPLDPEIAENTLVAIENPLAREDLLDVRNAMQELGFEQRQALALVAAAGLSYIEAAEICGCPIGTVKSRVNRARNELASILERRQLARRERTTVSASGAFDAIMAETADMQRPRVKAKASD
ncbi:MAG: sigma-70 family RNA polymerase sigma factor [Hyphomonadaceae bacterium]